MTRVIRLKAVIIVWLAGIFFMQESRFSVCGQFNQSGSVSLRNILRLNKQCGHSLLAYTSCVLFIKAFILA